MMAPDWMVCHQLKGMEVRGEENQNRLGRQNHSTCFKGSKQQQKNPTTRQNCMEKAANK